jgi:5-methylthioadenosine/S-adenosylhomocysteine deaminase
VSEVVFQGGTILTIDPQHRVLAGDVGAVDGAIVHAGGSYTPRTRDYEIVDCHGCVIMPGLVQAHVESYQALARGRADDLARQGALRDVIGPYEAALDEDGARAAAELAYAELLLGGTTAVLDVGPVRHTHAVFEAAATAGIRATIGRALMDAPDAPIPPKLRQPAGAALDESAQLLARWHGAGEGRLRYAYAPRAVWACTDELLREVAARARDRGVRVHTQAAEGPAEAELVRRRAGVGTGGDGGGGIATLDALGLLGAHACVAHATLATDAERRLLAARRAHVCHCPSSDLKRGAGIAPVPELIAAGASVALGAGGAPDSGNLDGFRELRLAALLHRPRAGLRALPAPEAVRMATLGGAAALGLADQIGSLELGKRADLIAVDLSALHVVPATGPFAAIAHAAQASDVRHVAVDGRLVVRDRRLSTLDANRVRDRARRAAARLFK